MGQREVRLAGEPSELPSTKTALLFSLYLAGAEHHIPLCSRAQVNGFGTALFAGTSFCVNAQIS